MKQERIILSLVTVALLLSIILITGVGYAAETDNPLLVSEQSEFKIAFTGKPTYTGDGSAILKITGPTTATMNITGLKAVGDFVTAIFTIENNSSSIYADIHAKVTNTNTEFFNVTSLLSESTIRPKKGKTILKITVELIKLPIEKAETTYISTDIFANPIYK